MWEVENFSLLQMVLSDFFFPISFSLRNLPAHCQLFSNNLRVGLIILVLSGQTFLLLDVCSCFCLLMKRKVIGNDYKCICYMSCHFIYVIFAGRQNKVCQKGKQSCQLIKLTFIMTAMSLYSLISHIMIMFIQSSSISALSWIVSRWIRSLSKEQWVQSVRIHPE